MNKISPLNRKQLMAGFWKGMAGVATLYSPLSMPAPAAARITPIRTPIREPLEALRSDWVATGMDLDAAIQTYSDSIQK